MNELFNTLPALLAEMEDNAAVRESIVFSAWRKTAGKALCEHAIAHALEKNKLIIAVTNDNWAKNLKKLRGQMIFKLNSLLGRPEIKTIEFIADEKSVIAEREKRGEKQFDEAKLNKLAEKQIDAGILSKSAMIKDESLREEFLRAAAISLAKKEMLKGK